MEKVSQKKRVLLVDDEESITKMLSLLLETRGYDVSVANSGKQALNTVSVNTNIILLDLLLPDEDGFDICRKLKEQALTRHIPIIILSAKLLPGDIVEGLYLGADDYLTKPFEYEELVARMEAVMRRSSIFNHFNNESNGEEAIIQEIRRILDQELITPFFQPIYTLNPMKILGLEGLCRPKVKGLLANPELLFKAAIQYGFYQDLEVLSWSKIAEYIKSLLQDEKIFLNCNPYLVEGPHFAKVKNIFLKNNIPFEKVVLELTERSAIRDFKSFHAKLEPYRQDGFNFAIDDVGGGYAGLESIVETKPEIVKIDRHIISDIHKDPIKKSIVKFIVSFCKENNILTIAEGIETKEELEAVTLLGVDAAQGYYLYRPTPDVDLSKMLAKVAS